MNKPDTNNTEPKPSVVMVDEMTACFEDSMDIHRLCLESVDDRATNEAMDSSQTSTNTATSKERGNYTNILDSWFELDEDNSTERCDTSATPTPSPPPSVSTSSIFDSISSHQNHPRQDSTRNTTPPSRGSTK